MKAFYTDVFVLPLPDGHRFPMEKYRRLRERCATEAVIPPAHLLQPAAATWTELALVHDRSYLERVRSGALSPAEEREIGFPWTPGMVERSRRSVGATIEAARTALDEANEVGWGIAANLAGGTHHSHAAKGGGFCVFNDAAVAIRVLQREGRIERVAVVDCDVHQGDGTAAIFATDPSVFTFSMHGAKNYPFRREASSLDVELADGASDTAFLDALRAALPQILDGFQPDLVIYLAGADPYENDRLGRLRVSREGLESRDRMVLEGCADRRIPVALTMAGGYAHDTEETVDIHLRTMRIAAALWRERVGGASTGSGGVSALEAQPGQPGFGFRLSADR